VGGEQHVREVPDAVDDDAIDVDNIELEQEHQQEHVDVASRRPEIPEQLKMSTNDGEFESYYVQLMTAEFGEDLDKLRQSNDFQPRSLPLLINALKEGKNMFDANQRKAVLEGQTK
jgi:ribosome assembly protein 3